MRIRTQNNRNGITLLFVISMIVLFLLMGTTFVIISNDYFKASRVRLKTEISTVDRSALVERAFRDIIRGPSLLDVDSPFRVQDLLSDEYGYGFKGFVNGFDDPATSGVDERPFVVGAGHFVRITLRSDRLNNITQLDQVFPLSRPDLAASHIGIAGDTFSGFFNGHVLTFTSGAVRGESTRIVDHQFDPAEDRHYFTVMPTWIDGGAVPVASLVGAEVVVNGREFSGTGAGGLNSGSTTNRLSAQALRPNRINESLADLTANYLADRFTSPNESYDAADFQNMFLSGRDSSGNIIPSWHRRSLYQHQYEALTVSGNLSVGELRRISFRPISVDLVDNATGLAPGDGILDVGSTANGNFIYNRFDDNPGSLNATNAATDLEVDTDSDGKNDSIFIDPGYGIITDAYGKRFKPLVAYRIVDMDGRLNINAHGNLTQVTSAGNFISTYTPLIGGAAPLSLPRGDGYGPPEVNLQSFFGTSYEQVLWSRYGNDLFPGSSATRKSTKKNFGHPIDTVDWGNGRFGTVSRGPAPPSGTGLRRGTLYASSAMNIHGRLGVATPQSSFMLNGNALDDFRDANYPLFTNGLPVIDMLESSNTANEFDSNPYEMSFAPLPYGDPRDQPFTPYELERVLRQFDVDSKVLPGRLWDDARTVWTGDANKRNLVTTDSYEVPTLKDNFVATIVTRLSSVTTGLTQAQRITRAEAMVSAGMFAPELIRGLKMNPNRPLGNGYDDDGDGVVDEPDEANLEYNRDHAPNWAFDLNGDLVAGGGGLLGSEANARQLLARNLYVLALLLTDRVDIDLDGDGMLDPVTDRSYERLVAQWAVNVVDFRDPDSIMTRFQFDWNPWDGVWNDEFTLPADGTAVPASDTNTVWGCERPEMLISETWVTHDRRNEDGPVGGGDTSSGDNDYDSRLRPEAHALIELYNPWTQNSLNQRLDESLYTYSGSGTNQGVNLARKSPGTDRTPVWRLSIERPDRPAAGVPDPGDTTPLRYVYFTNPLDGGTDVVTDDDIATVEVFYATSSGVVRPGEQAVVGSVGYDQGSDDYAIPMGRLNSKTALDEVPDNLDIANTRRIILNPVNGTVERFPTGESTTDASIAGGVRSARIVQVDQVLGGTPRSFNVSDPFGGYNSTAAYVETAIEDGIAYTGGADTPMDATTDTNRDDDDLQYLWLNGETGGKFRVVKLQRLANPSLAFDVNTNPYITIDRTDMDLVGFNGAITSPASGSAPDLAGITLTGMTPTSATGNSSQERGAEDTDRLLFRSAHQSVAAGLPGTADHYFDRQLNESLGKTNDAYFENAAANGFAWLTWNNRPYVSHLELTNVPYTAPNWMTRMFSDKEDFATLNPYAGNDDQVRGRFGHLINFFANDEDGGGDRTNFYRLMDYLEVPSRFVGTEQQLNPANFPAPFDFMPRYRVPGKINLNTIYCDDDSDANKSTIWEALQGNYATLGCNYAKLRDSRQAGTGSSPTDFGNPFRVAGDGVNVPPSGLGVPSITGPGSTVFRNDEFTTGTTGEPLLDFDSSTPANDADRSAYFRNAQRQRLGNLVTTKSSVFAIWVTVAYFEVDENGLVGAEIGADTGEIERNRGFFIFDRSIPMGFEPGKNHNIERGILVQSMIE